MDTSILCILVCIFTKYSFCKKPHNKREQDIWKIECELGIISDVDCPVDGGWSMWGPWSPCHGTCDDVGHRRRSRQCDNPPASQDGIPCSGPSTQTDTCYLKNCTTSDYKQLISGDFLRTQALSQLEAVPALLERCLRIECNFDAIQAALSADNTWQLNSESVWNSLQCVKHNIGCPLEGSWGAWGAWSACSSRCGRGVRWRLRRCDSPPPSSSDLVCQGEPLQADECEGNQCAVDINESKTDRGGYWSHWGSWSSCSEACGVGVKRRKRSCLEKHVPHNGDTWGTHCQGPHDQLEMCFNNRCSLDGGWVGWGGWSPCSQSCGIGKRSRVRSCTRPIPSGGGKSCSGSRTDVSACYINPCDAYTHLVATFNGEGLLHYNIENKRFRFLHVYIRFKPTSQFGTLYRRGAVNGAHVRVSLQKLRVCVDASGNVPECSLSRLCTLYSLEPDMWYSAVICITGDTVSLQVGSFQPAVKGTFPCNTHLMEEEMDFRIGERFYGEIQEVVVNFIPLSLKAEKDISVRSRIAPYSTSNIAYERASTEEAFINFEYEVLSVPCFDDQEEWSLELKVKTKRESGLLLFLIENLSDNYIMVSLQNMRIKLKVAVDNFHSESCSSSDYMPGEWLDIRINKKTETNAIEAKLNGQERMHVIIPDEYERNYHNKNISNIHRRKDTEVVNNDEHVTTNLLKNSQNTVSPAFCNDEFYIGGIPEKVMKILSQDIPSFTGILASLSINEVLRDLSEFSLERNIETGIQLSIRTASVSGAYYEASWGRSKRLNLTCLHARFKRTPDSAQWLLFDTLISGTNTGKKIRSTDDGRILKLMATADNELRGFYTCRAHANKRSVNVVTYGVIGKALQDIHSPDLFTFVAFCSTLTLLLATLAWLLYEGINDVQTGYGFFREKHLSPTEEADAVCEFIDRNAHLIGSKSAVRIAKNRARCIAKRLNEIFASDSNYEGNKINISEKATYETTTQSEPETLPSMPVQICEKNTNHGAFKCEISFVSSPRHGTKIGSQSTRLSSTSPIDTNSPRILCSRLIKRRHPFSPRQSMSAYTKIQNKIDLPLKFNTIARMPTIQSSDILNLSPGQKVLEKFQQLK